VEILDGELRDPRAPMGHVDGEAERLEAAYRLPDRRDAHPERAGKVLEAERIPGGELAGEDRLLQLGGRDLGHRPVVPSAVDRRGGGLHARHRLARLIKCQIRDEARPP
jgi:hypothetical protein